MPAPLLDDDARFLQRVEDLSVEQFVAHAGIEALDVADQPPPAPVKATARMDSSARGYIHRAIRLA
jgi:hypothetical protein